MAERKPVVMVSGQLKELPAGDTLPPQTPATHSHATSDVTGLDAALAGKEPAISAGTTAQYWRGDKTWRDFFTDVRSATLTGLSTATNAVVAATDTVLAAIGKLQAQVSAKFDKTGGDVNGNINFTGTARRITGDFSNATIANRVMFQTNVVNNGTDLTIVPNGTVTYAAVSARSSDSANASVAVLAVNGSSGAVELWSSRTGAGAYLPFRVIVGDVERLRIDPTTGNVLATSGALGYGAGAGGTVVQAAAKSAHVTLNKPCGRIILSSSAMPANSYTMFILNNTYIGNGDFVAVDIADVGTGGAYSVNTAQVIAGSCVIVVRNVSAGALAEAVELGFVVIKGAKS